MFFKKETEHDKISNELFEKYFPKEIAEDYYSLGYVDASIHYIKMLRKVAECNFDQKDIEKLIEGMEQSFEDTPKLNELFKRLKKDN